MPLFHDIIFNLAGAKYFTILGAKCGYWQVPLDSESSKLTTFSTIFGNYKFLRLPFDLNVSQDVFQKRIEEALKGLPKLGVIVDDILLWADTKEKALENSRKALDRCREVGIRLNLAKCKFCVQEVKYFGHILNQNGISPDSDKIESTCEMPAPTLKKSCNPFSAW